MREQSTRLEAELFGHDTSFRTTGSGYWLRQRGDDGQAVINAKSSRQQGIQLAGVSIFRFDESGHFRDRIEAKSATLEAGYWRLEEARFFASGVQPVDRDTYRLKTNLTPAQVGESFATPETVPFWQLPSYIELAENAGLAAAGYRLQYYQLLALPFYLASMVLLAASVSLRFFRIGRRAEGGARRHRRRLRALRPGKNHRRSEQGRADVADGGGRLAGAGGRPHRSDRRLLYQEDG